MTITEEQAVALAREAESLEERYLHEQLAMLRQAYEAAAKPYVDQLVSIHSMRTTSIIVPRDFITAIESLKDNTL